MTLPATVGAVVGGPVAVKEKFFNDEHIIPISIRRVAIVHPI